MRILLASLFLFFNNAMNILSISSHHFHPLPESKIFRTLCTTLSCVVTLNDSADHTWELNSFEFRSQCMVENRVINICRKVYNPYSVVFRPEHLECCREHGGSSLHAACIKEIWLTTLSLKKSSENWQLSTYIKENFPYTHLHRTKSASLHVFLKRCSKTWKLLGSHTSEKRGLT